jgi:hypothetical protein
LNGGQKVGAMNRLVRDYRAAFSSVSGVLGMLTSVISLMSLLHQALSFELAGLVSLLVEAYRACFYPFFEAASSYIRYRFSDTEKDIFSLYLVFGFAISRVFSRTARRVDMFASNGAYLNERRAAPKFMAFVDVSLAVLSAFIWPLFFVAMSFEGDPVFRAKEKGGERTVILFGNRFDRSAYDDVQYDHSFWRMLAIQVVAVFGALGLMVLVNAGSAALG